MTTITNRLTHNIHLPVPLAQEESASTSDQILKISKKAILILVVLASAIFYLPACGAILLAYFSHRYRDWDQLKSLPYAERIRTILSRRAMIGLCLGVMLGGFYN